MSGVSFIPHRISSEVTSLTIAANWLGVKKMGGTKPEESEETSEKLEALYDTKEAKGFYCI